MLNRVASALRTLALAFLLAGCSSARLEREFTRVPTPLPPAFLTGPGSVLLTNTTGFSAQVDAQSGAVATEESGSRGQLIGAGPKLMFAPVLDKAAEKRFRAGNFLFIWDVATGKGCVISEALQAYAPISSDLRATNVSTRSVGARPSQVATVQINNGNAAMFDVLGSTELPGFPARISSLSNAIPFTVTFTRIRRETVAADLFMPPEGFAPYSSPEALVDEIAARQRNYRRRPASELEQLQITQPGGGY